MSGGYEVVQSDIRDAAADLQDVADGVAGADPSAAVADIVAAEHAAAVRFQSMPYAQRPR